MPQRRCGIASVSPKSLSASADTRTVPPFSVRSAVDRIERRGIVDAVPAGDLLRRRADRRVDDQESHAAMDGKHAAMVVHAYDFADVTARQQEPPQRCAPVIGGQPRRQDQAKAAAKRERERKKQTKKREREA